MRKDLPPVPFRPEVRPLVRGVPGRGALLVAVVRWFRRLALNIQRTVLGEDPGTLPVMFKENAPDTPTWWH